MGKNIFWILMLLFFTACKEEKKQDNTPDENEETVEKIVLPELLQFDEDKQEELNGWKAYTELRRTIREFREEKGGDVPLQLDNLLEKEKKLSDSIPEKFDNASVRSRIAALKTYLMQTRLEAPDPVPERYLKEQKVKILDAFNVFDRQLYVIMRESLTDELLDEVSNKPLARRDSVPADSVREDSVPVKQ
ncbi:hypothetical protein LS482_11960 [Sinomicrobium kalidii]|uniref:hypothetical protein n=1 Tax=Sinomicrobium kalidii TaxID=2900738 RepID=UPI001E447E93|nr:hypothetical protein [Sinomicrobium kalidii]UGU14420.1 hypothetical protein LS482_11960 [Sinomicrobium kalidii]